MSEKINNNRKITGEVCAGRTGTTAASLRSRCFRTRVTIRAGSSLMLLFEVLYWVSTLTVMSAPATGT